MKRQATRFAAAAAATAVVLVTAWLLGFDFNKRGFRACGVLAHRAVG